LEIVNAQTRIGDREMQEGIPTRPGNRLNFDRNFSCLGKLDRIAY
jgi:hypothetical protein